MASITCLYIALKVHNHKTVETRTIANLSNGEITVNDILWMECMILESLSFDLCPPICCSFIRSFYAFLPSGAQNATGQDLIQRASFLAELSVMEISFRTLHQSSIAFAAISTALDTMDQNFLLPSEKEHFIRKIECSFTITTCTCTIRNMLTRTCLRCNYFIHQAKLLPEVKNASQIDVRDDIETKDQGISNCMDHFSLD